ETVFQIDTDRQPGGGDYFRGVRESLIAADLAIRFTDRECIAGTTRRECFEAGMGQQHCAADVPRVRNNKGSVAPVEFGESGGGFSLRQHTIPHLSGGRAKVPSTTCTKFRSSRRMIRLLWAKAKFSSASASDRSRARYVSYAARLSNAISPHATSFVPSCGRK